jgi:DNA-binding MarR family transcriptional regulator
MDMRKLSWHARRKTRGRVLFKSFEERMQKRGFLTKTETAFLLCMLKEETFYTAKMMKRVGTTFAYTSYLFRYWEKEGLIERVASKDRKKKLFRLTQKGEKIAKLLNEVYSLF